VFVTALAMRRRKQNTLIRSGGESQKDQQEPMPKAEVGQRRALASGRIGIQSCQRMKQEAPSTDELESGLDRVHIFR
jgi:hypothetical protein